MLVGPEVEHLLQIFFFRATVISSLPKEIVVGVAIDIDSRKRLGVDFWWRTAIQGAGG